MKKLIYLAVFLGICAAAWFYGKPMYDLHFTTIDLSDKDKIIYIKTGSSLKDIAQLLNEEKIVSEEVFLDFSERLEFTDDKVEAGKYNIVGKMKVKHLIYGLKNGNQEIKDVRITFNNCRSIEEMAGKVAPNIEADSSDIVNFACDPRTIDEFGFNDATFMAMFLPDTYEVGEWDMSAEEFIDFMADQFKNFWRDEGGTLRGSKLHDLGLEQSEVTTLASILEAEQGIHSTEWETIAGLYVNRLRKGMKLESDPTAKYCWGDELDGVQRILSEHLKKDCPYNTYLYAGLPPGPISMPSKKALDAVLNAESHNYLFMCARPDNSGLHNFAETFAQHLVNARKFWKYMDSRNG